MQVGQRLLRLLNEATIEAGFDKVYTVLTGISSAFGLEEVLGA